MVLIDCERRELPSREGAEQEAATRRFLFVDNARFVSIMAILALQCGLMVEALVHPASPRLLRGLENLLQFGVIVAFLMSGFLLGERFETAPRLEYLRRRVKKVFVPWLFWFYLQIVCLAAGAMATNGFRLRFSLETVQTLGGLITSTTGSSAFWLVPNLFLGIMVLLVFRRRLRSVWFGAALFAVDLVCSVDFHGRWTATRHPLGMLGLMFYMWLGANGAIHYEAALAKVRQLRLGVVGGGVLVAGAISLGEMKLHPVFGFGAPQLGTQLFSLAVVVLLMRVPYALWPRFVDVRRQMFGVYLSQTLMLTVVSVLLPMLFDVDGWRGTAGVLGLWVVTVALVSGVSVGISQGLATHRNLGWMVGDLSLYRAERRAAEMIHERALALRGMVSAGLLPAEEDEEFGEATLARSGGGC